MTRKINFLFGIQVRNGNRKALESYTKRILISRPIKIGLGRTDELRGDTSAFPKRTRSTPFQTVK